MTAPKQVFGSVFSATAPSNIAFVKYWGKRDVHLQWPANDSISMTLSTSNTTTTAQKTENTFDHFTMGTKSISSDSHPDDKIFRHLDFIRTKLNRNGRLDISSYNSFPTGCGIASSASGFAALTLAAAAALVGDASWEALATAGASRETLALWARQGSGSAGRSVFGGFVQWTAGNHPQAQAITEEFAPDHWNLADVIVVLSDVPKHTSSSEAHLAAWASPLFKPRLAGLPDRLTTIKQALRERDLATLGREIEVDALEMHGVAMTGSPAVHYLSQDTLNFISWVRTERRAGVLPAWFTIDAGPNVHLICRAEDVQSVALHVKKHWQNAELILDRVGSGPRISIVNDTSTNTSQGTSNPRQFSEGIHA